MVLLNRILLGSLLMKVGARFSVLIAQGVIEFALLVIVIGVGLGLAVGLGVGIGWLEYIRVFGATSVTGCAIHVLLLLLPCKKEYDRQVPKGDR